jgi:tRNA threonylcarbamoyladenosine biosynthesis protein TsaB
VKILALDTSTHACSVALWHDREGHEVFELAPNRHSSLILPMVEEILADNGLSMSQCDAIAFGQGPGSFTGLRIGAGVAQGLAFGVDIPVVPVSSLLAQASRVEAQNVLAAFDARMGQIYWGTYSMGPDRMMLPEEGVGLSEAGAVRLRSNQDWVAAGTGCDKYQALIEQVNAGTGITFIQGSYPHALDVAKVGSVLFEQGKAIPAEQAVPEYVRNKI